MKATILLIAIVGLGLMGCKKDVQFSNAQGEPLNSASTASPQLKGPVVRIIKSPADHKVGEETSAIFDVVPGDGDVVSVSCKVNFFKVDCDLVSGVVKLVGWPLGLHILEVIALDDNDLSGQAKKSWSVFDKYKKHKETLEVDTERMQTDILFVVDNSLSMKEEQRKISKRFNRFIDQIKDIDWRLAITTTDVKSNRWWADGQLSPYENGQWFLDSKRDSKEAQKLFGKNITRSESGSNVEQGIFATYRSIERAVNPVNVEDQRLADFFRDPAALAVVVVSDEDESANTFKNQGDNLVELVKTSWGQDKVFQFNSIIVHTRECLRGDGFAMGYRYEDLSRQTKGTVGDICADNYSELLRDIGKGVANLQKTHKLACVPQDIDKDGRVDLEILPLGPHRVPGYTLDGDSITFDKALQVGRYQFHYFCLTN